MNEMHTKTRANVGPYLGNVSHSIFERERDFSLYLSLIYIKVYIIIKMVDNQQYICGRREHAHKINLQTVIHFNGKHRGLLCAKTTQKQSIKLSTSISILI